MSPEQQPAAELTAEQKEVADYFIEACGLQEVADDNLEMMGENGSVRYGLGRCAEYLMDRTPDEIKEMVLTKLKAQSQSS